MKRITRYLLPVIILVAVILALAILGLFGEVLATIGSAVTNFFFKHWDYALIIIVTSAVTSLICAWLEEHKNDKPKPKVKKNPRRTNAAANIEDDE